MSRWQKWTMVAVLMAAVAIPATVMAADAAKPAAPAAAAKPAAPAAAPAGNEHLAGAWLDKFHKPFDGLTLGLDIRLREEYARSMHMNDSQGDVAPGATRTSNNAYDRQRYRARFSASYAVTPDVDINARWVWEMSTYRHSTPSQQRDDEILFDRLNITWRNAFNAPLTLVVGRQDISLGNGWLVYDGTPADGSRTVYFDAVRATYDLSDRTKIDLIGIANRDDESKYLEPLNYNNNRTVRHSTDKQDENGAILYITDKWNESTTAEYYYIYKQDEASSWYREYTAGRTKAKTSRYKDEINTLGVALSGKLSGNWGYRTEVAGQFGSKNTNSMGAWGTNNRLTYSFKDERNSVANLDYEYLSGDKRGTEKVEGFDPLWGQYPNPNRGGDLWSYMMGAESSNGDYTNMHRGSVGYTFDVAPKWTMKTQYSLLWADQEYLSSTGTKTGPTGTKFSDNGLFRGQMLSAVLTYKCCKNLSMHFMADYFQPGSYYDHTTRDDAYFLRYNLEFTF
jgi:hypothetical protein